MMNAQSMPQPQQLRFSVDEYYKMIELGMLKDYKKTEIINGELIQKMTIGDRHAAAVNRLNRILVKNVSDEILVSVQNPVRLSDFDEPEPDIALADLTKYNGARHPHPSEVILLIEVSDSTLKYDRDFKIPLYAEAGIPEVWIVNLPHNRIEIHQKLNDGVYQIVKIFKADETVISESLPGFSIPAKDILG